LLSFLGPLKRSFASVATFQPLVVALGRCFSAVAAVDLVFFLSFLFYPPAHLFLTTISLSFSHCISRFPLFGDSSSLCEEGWGHCRNNNKPLQLSEELFLS
jgi:hypothetical protein